MESDKEDDAKDKESGELEADFFKDDAMMSSSQVSVKLLQNKSNKKTKVLKILKIQEDEEVKRDTNSSQSHLKKTKNGSR